LKGEKLKVKRRRNAFSLAQTLSKWESSSINEVNRVFSRAHPFPTVFVLQAMRWVTLSSLTSSSNQIDERVSVLPLLQLLLLFLNPNGNSFCSRISVVVGVALGLWLPSRYVN